MANIGNEAKLILTLAEEKMKAQVATIKVLHNNSPEYIKGYNRSAEHYQMIVKDITRDLVAK